ncbi:mitochondrial homologous recombination protein 1 [Kluyveromyces marxianus]|uniref:Large ribosomal subunit protein mL67 n=2 Tax=Kluyveromyces marxianus TaxID=4911 RepID=W0TC89_KLUMD|nr:mitochondrial homologous recombination protein 1 [Kluyveromyces marxianus DMKU3-1042]KAG0679427.1 mitochondrial homologous recombination protein 1 [Kluyveromyces marxianus]KAG0685033.1 mitochondrial homologous recombination protein 1 [Kluyveromyces marxianus]QGN15438.1 mitochondrial -like proteinous recombination protein 1 [Kluyveromyces marxianus]BAO39724.1 mitochondrial homologous recombination protein 1 [Kluyveromyces marxianus DMKU3-1042]BAP71208.1 mitochondrial homologous recombination
MSKHIAITKFRPANWLKKAGYAPQVFVFRNLESGQVLYSQFPTFTWAQVEKNFQRPNWENKKPSTRRDIWKCMAVVDLPDYESSVKLYQNLCRLRYLRDVTLSKQAKEMRKKNEFGHTWYSSQFRPTYSQEAVADLRECLLKLKDFQKSIKVHWEDEWRMGDKEKYWTPVLPELTHTTLQRLGNVAREESVILKELGEKAKSEFAKLRKEADEAKNISL